MLDFTLADFHFLRPLWLLAIVPLFLLIALLKRMNQQRSGWQSVLPSHLYQHLVANNGVKTSKPPLYVLVVAWTLACLALAGPTWQRLPQPVYQLNSGKVVVLDMSLSMRATDVTPNRLTRAKYKAIDLVKAIAEGETGLVAYAGDAFTISPLSSDGQNLTALIPSLSPEIMPVAGSEPFLGLESAIALLRNAGYQQGEIFWITDGIENTQVAEVSKLLENSPYRLSVLSIGTPDGAPIQLVNGDFLKDNSGAVVVPRLKASNLQTLARKGGGRYIAMRTDDSDIDYLKNQSVLSSEEEKSSETEDKFGDEWQEMGPYLLILLLPLAAYGFRRGLLGIFAVFMLLPGYTPPARATWWDDLWQTADQQGQHAFQTENYEEAAKHFNDPMWRGTAAYKAQNYAAALDAFRTASGAQARYNEGNTLAQLGEIDEAIKAYEKALAIDPAHEDAQANKTLLEQQKQQQQDQQNQEPQENSDQQQQDENQQGENNQSGDQQEGQKEEQKEGQDSQQDQNADNNSGQSSQENQQQSQQDDSEQSASEEQPEQNEQDSENNSQQADSQSPQQGEREQSQDEQSSQPASMDENEQTDAQDESQQQAASMGAQAPQELTDEQKEQMQRMQTLLNRVPDDPAFLLKRKMQIENQKRRQQRTPTQRQRNW